MSDIFLFMKHGWKNLWKLNIIWFFSFLSIVNNFTNFISINQEYSLSTQFIFLTFRFLLIIPSFIGSVAVPYLAYRFLINESTTIQQALQAVKKFSVRIIGSGFLFFLILSPLYCFAIANTMANSNIKPIQLSDQTLLAFFPLAIFSSMWDFTRLGFFAHDLNIKQSISSAWNILKSHFFVLGILGVIRAIILYMASAIAGIITLLIQSDFDFTVISELSLLNPYASLYNNLLFLIINSFLFILLNPYTAFVFTSAYLKYDKVK